MRPIPELPASASRLGTDAAGVPLRIVDVSVGGLALVRGEGLLAVETGSNHVLRLSLGTYGEHQITVVVMWCGDGLVGAKYVDLTPSATAAIRAYVAELLERGAPS